MRRTWRRVTAAILLTATAVLVPSGAGASFFDGSAATNALGSATLAPPTAPGTAHGACSTLSGAKIVVSWTATASTWASGYEVGMATTAGGPYSPISGVSGQATTSFTSAFLSFSTTYYFVVRSTKGSWRSVWTSEVSRTTKSFLCL